MARLNFCFQNWSLTIAQNKANRLNEEITARKSVSIGEDGNKQVGQ